MVFFSQTDRGVHDVIPDSTENFELCPILLAFVESWSTGILGIQETILSSNETLCSQELTTKSFVFVAFGAVRNVGINAGYSGGNRNLNIPKRVRFERNVAEHLKDDDYFVSPSS